MNPRSAAVRVKGLSYTVDQRTVLNDLEFEFSAGGCVLLTGENGSGKSTLLRILAGLVRPDTGTVSFEGTASWEGGGGRDTLSFVEARDQLLALSVYLHQRPYMFDGTVYANLEYGLRRQRIARRAAHERVMQALDLCGLDSMAQRHARQLSGGEQQRLAIARAWILEPRYLLLDEPTTALDQEGRSQTLELISQLVSKDTGVVLATHDPPNTLPEIDQRLHLDQGSLSPEATSAAHTANATAVDRHNGRSHPSEETSNDV